MSLLVKSDLQLLVEANNALTSGNIDTVLTILETHEFLSAKHKMSAYWLLHNASAIKHKNELRLGKTAEQEGHIGANLHFREALRYRDLANSYASMFQQACVEYGKEEVQILFETAFLYD